MSDTNVQVHQYW